MALYVLRVRLAEAQQRFLEAAEALAGSQAMAALESPGISRHADRIREFHDAYDAYQRAKELRPSP